MILPIVIWPAQVLTRVAGPVTTFDAQLAELVQNMFDTMYAAPGRGLAAPQIGESRALFVMDATWKEGLPQPRVFINPQVVATGSETATNAEGCLSLPGFTLPVTRPLSVTIRYQDLQGDWHNDVLDGFAAICAQHEFDHLTGTLTLDRAAPADLDGIAAELAALRDGQTPAGVA